MPLASGLGIHDDTKHKGSAKRATASGVAPLDAGSKVPTVNLPDMLPIGAVLPYGAAAAPTGYLLCDGAAISRTTYAALFAIIGDAYGVGDGSTTFNLPNLEGSIPVGIGGSGVTNLGDSGGAQTHTHDFDPNGGNCYAAKDGTSPSYDSFLVNGDATTVRPIPTNASSNMQPYQGVNYIIKV